MTKHDDVLGSNSGDTESAFIGQFRFGYAVLAFDRDEPDTIAATFFEGFDNETEARANKTVYDFNSKHEYTADPTYSTVSVVLTNPKKLTIDPDTIEVVGGWRRKAWVEKVATAIKNHPEYLLADGPWSYIGEDGAPAPAEPTKPSPAAAPKAKPKAVRKNVAKVAAKKVAGGGARPAAAGKAAPRNLRGAKKVVAKKAAA